MAAFKYPRYVEFRDALPMSATGKVLKRELATKLSRRRAVALLRSLLHAIRI